MYRKILVIICLLTTYFNLAAEPTAFLDSVVGLDEVPVSRIKAVSAVSFPSAATNITAEEADRYDVDGVKGMSEIAPNFYMPQYGSRMTSSIYVRGLGTRIDQPIVALNVDNVPMLNKDSYDFDMLDVERVEVVRGPQSLLYGRNSIGGVINITTLSPLQWQGVRAEVGYGSGNTWQARLSGYAKLSSTLGVSIGGSYSTTDGFYRNKYTGNKVDNERQWLGKTKLAWRPSDNFLLENSAWVTVTRQGGYPYESLATHEINHNDTCFYRRTSVADGLTMLWTGDNISVSSITGFQYINDNMTLDNDFLPQEYFTLTQARHEWTLTQDFIVKGSAKHYRHLSGATGFYKRGNMHAPVVMGDDGLTNFIEVPFSQAAPGMRMIWDERSMLLDSRFTLPTWGWSLYHKSEYDWNNWTASVGLRLAFERSSIDYMSNVNSSMTMYREQGPALIPIRQVPVEIAMADRLHMTSLQLLPEFKLSYNFNNNVALGVIVSKGYKAGGYNTQMFSDILQQQLMTQMGGSMTYDVDEVISYEPEKSWSYEVNAAATLFDGALDIDGSIFYIDCTDQQMTMFPDGSTGRIMANAGKTRSMGVELSATWRLPSHWVFAASYGLADARFRSFNNGVIDCEGNRVPYAPRNTFFASGTYSTGLSFAGITGIDVTATCRGAGKIYWNEENTEYQSFYAMLGAKVTLHTKVVDVELWGENLTDTGFSAFYFESMGNKFVQRGTPRQIGMTLRYDFSAQ